MPVSSTNSRKRSAASALKDAAAGHQQRALGFVEHGQDLLGLDPGGLRLASPGGARRLDVELDLGHLYVERQVDQYRPGRSLRISWKAFWNT